MDVEHQVAVSALRSQTNDFRILVAREVDDHSVQSSSSGVSVVGNPISNPAKINITKESMKMRPANVPLVN